MKKFLAILCFVVTLTAGLCFGCNNSNAIKLNKKYYITNVGFMGFSGGRADIQNYIDSQDDVEEINIFTEYFDLALRLQVEFTGDTTGKLTIPQLVAAFETTEAKNMITEAKDLGLINSSGDFTVTFDYKKDKNAITITTVHTQLLSEENNGDMSFSEALSKLIAYAQKEGSTKEIKIVNENSNVLTLNKGKLEISFMLEYRSNKEKQNPDIATNLLLTLSK